MEQIHQQQQYLQEMLQLRIRVIAMANSRTMLVSQDGLPLHLARPISQRGSKQC